MPTWGQLLSTAKESIVSTAIPSGEIDDIAYSAYTELVDYHNRARSGVFLRWNSPVRGQLPLMIPVSSLSVTPQISNSPSLPITDVFFIDKKGWATASVGGLILTTDGGQTWSSPTQFLGSGVSNKSVYFSNPNQGVIVGGGGRIATTDNGGGTFTIRTSSTTQSLNSVYFANATTGWAVGDFGTIRATTNGGVTWVAQTLSTIQNLNSVFFANATTGWTVGTGGVIFATTNGGATWVIQASSTTRDLNSVFFVNATTGWAVGDSGTIRATTDGGVTWVAQTSSTGQSLRGVYFVDAQTGWAVGDNGTILATRDGGANWNLKPIGLTTNFLSVHFVSRVLGYVVGDFGTILALNEGEIQRYLLPTDADLKNGNPIATVRADSGVAFESATYDDMVVESAVSPSVRKNLFTVENNVLFLLTNDSVKGFFYNYFYVAPKPTSDATDMNFPDSLIPFWKMLFLKQFYQSRNIPLTVRSQRQLDKYIASLS